MSTPETKTETETTVEQKVEKPETKILVESPEFKLDDFMNESFTDPELSKVFSQEHKGLPDWQTVVQRHVTPEGRKVLSNLRSDYTRKTQEIASLKSSLEAERKAIAAERAALYDGEYAKKIKETASIATTDLDPYTSEGIAKLIEIETAKKLQEQLKPMQEKIELERQKALAEDFVTKHPEIKTEAFKARLVPLLQARPDISVDDAYWVVKGQLADLEKETQTKLKTEAKAFIRSTADGRIVDTAALPKGKSAREIALLLQSIK